MENEERIGKLEDRVEKLEITLNKDLSEIKTDLAVIKNQTSNTNKESDLKNEVICKDVASNTDRINKLEANQRWIVITVIGAIAGAVIKLIIN